MIPHRSERRDEAEKSRDASEYRRQSHSTQEMGASVRFKRTICPGFLTSQHQTTDHIEIMYLGVVDNECLISVQCGQKTENNEAVWSRGMPC